MKLISIHRSVLMISLIASSSIFTACGSGGFVKKASVQANTVNNDVYADVLLGVDTGAIRLPGVQLPIPDPKNPGSSLGTLTIRDAFGGNYNTELVASVNLSRAAQVQGYDGHYLPNGSALPVGGLSNVPVIAIPLKNGMIAYIALTQKVAVVGAAIPIRQFDTLGQYVGGLNFFPGFDFGNGVRGIAGIYTSPPSVGQNGLAFFVDASSVVQKFPVIGPSFLADETVVTFTDVVPSRGKQKKVARALWDLGADQAGTPLTIGQ